MHKDPASKNSTNTVNCHLSGQILFERLKKNIKDTQTEIMTQTLELQQSPFKNKDDTSVRPKRPK